MRFSVERLVLHKDYATKKMSSHLKTFFPQKFWLLGNDENQEEMLWSLFTHNFEIEAINRINQPR